MKPTAVMIGAGNVATHLAPALINIGVNIVQVFSRTENTASILAKELNTSHVTNLDEITSKADYYFYAVKDAAISEILQHTSHFQGIHIHTAGSVNLSVFEVKVQQYGVLYPLQTFSKTKKTDFLKVPLFVEGKNDTIAMQIMSLAKNLSTDCHFANSEQRSKLHLAAVFACNFTNMLYDIASELVDEKVGGFDILKPLIAETAEKVQTISPYNAQTGPATRFDSEIIQKHIEMLNAHPEWAGLYESMSQLIYQRQKQK